MLALTASDGLPVAHDESLKITANTVMTSIARSYRVVIILDISPSALIVVSGFLNFILMSVQKNF